jgi:pyruvate-ferredoxin/flavodoxin oxidoreductase
MARKLKTMDGNTAAAHVAYAFTDVAAIYPITPSSVMAELADDWSAHGRKNIFGQQVKLVEMQSEAGAAGAVHGSLLSGALTTTFTASQGLLLMIPNMFKIAGELLPCVIHVSARTVASHALNIFGDHSDVMACRSTGFAMLASANPQEVMDLSAVAHLSAIKGSVPFINFFDGFRTSHEIAKIEVWDYDELKEMLDMDAVRAFKDRANLPSHPVLHGSAQNPDIFFQNREASNTWFDNLPDIVQGYMDEINRRNGSHYKLFSYFGAPDAEYVIVAMGSVCNTAQEIMEYLNARGEKVGVINVHLYRPFSAKHLISVLPDTVKKIAVLDRTKESGALGEPLYLDVVAALRGSKFDSVPVIGGRYGLGSKDTTPGSVISVVRNLQKDEPIQGFTIGIVDDVTHKSLPIDEEPDTTPKDIKSLKFWGLGSDGTVGANKNSIKIIGDHTDMTVQAYFQYDSKKSGGVTISHLRFGKSRIKSSYYVTKADFVACHAPSYMEKYDVVQDVKPGGVFLLNWPWSKEELDARLPARAKKYIADNGIRFYIVDAVHKAQELGLGGRTNTILQSAFFKLSEILPIDDAVKYMKDAIVASYGRKGEKVVNMNFAAVDAGLDSFEEVEVPDSWHDPAPDKPPVRLPCDRPELLDYLRRIMKDTDLLRGDSIPVSAFVKNADGTMSLGTAHYERRHSAVDIPRWIPENCIQCNRCSFVCPHAAIRPFAYSAEELSKAPEGTVTVKMLGKGCEDYAFGIQVDPADCLGCGSCVNVCPAKEKALVMAPADQQPKQQAAYDYAYSNVEAKKTPFAIDTVKGSQFVKPLFEYSGACAGCGETPYAKLITQLFGERMHLANATGCSSIWGGSAPIAPYTVSKAGRGPAWSNSLFEDNAEFGFGMLQAMKQRRALMAEKVTALTEDASLKEAAQGWLDAMNDSVKAQAAGDALLEACKGSDKEEAKFVLANADLLPKPSFWCFGGDGWAYDIGYGGLDHVLASGENINVFVFDTEVYSNTGGQASKATPIGAVAQFAAAGKAVKKKDLAQIAISYGYVYVAQVAMGADYNQCLKALAEAESYDGPSLVIGYAPCINHGSRAGMGKSQSIMKAAVDAGYWNLFRYDPRMEAQGKNPLSIDSGAPSGKYEDFLMSEVRYSSLALSFPERAKVLFKEAAENAEVKYKKLLLQKQMYDLETK